MGPERIFGMTPWVRRLVVANLIVFLLQKTLFTAPTFLATVGFDPVHAFERPWTFLSFLFLHAGFLHLAFAMLGLFIFGPDVEERMGGRAFAGYYLLCGLGAPVLSYGLILLSLDVRLLLGAWCAVYGIALAYAWYWPSRPIYFFALPEPVPAKWLVVSLIAISLVLAWLARDGVAHLAHLGGFGAGFLYLRLQDLRLAQAERHLRRSSQPSVLLHPAARAAGRAAGAPKPPRAARDASQAEIDRVLDKISAQGMGSLTPAERKFLTEMSRKMRSEEER